MKTTLTIIICFLFSGILFSQEVPAKYQKLWQEINESDEEAAQKKVLKLLKKDPQDPWLNWMMGESYTLYDTEKAKEYFEKTIELDSTIGPAYYSLAGMLDDSLDIDQKIGLYSKAIKFDPSFGFSNINRGELYLKKGRSDLAMLDAEAAKKCEFTELIIVDALIIEILNAEGKTKELHALVKNGEYSDKAFLWDQSTIDIVIRVYEELNQPEDVCKICRMIQQELSMFEKDPPPNIQEKIKNNCK
jgi:tetratricopeptide (TPR) repeat protein